MKTLVAAILVACLFGVLSGCHSGIMRGAGADVERLGDRMQR
jgi:predicted small secreted protein